MARIHLHRKEGNFMISKRLIAVIPSTILAIATAASTAFAVSALSFGWLLGLIVLALAALLADVLKSYWETGKIVSSPAAWIIAIAFLAAGWVLKIRGLGLLPALLPQFGVIAWFVLVFRLKNDRQACIGVKEINNKGE
ncbi:MAG TPA: hypothetical protein VF472_23480 [Burkholderiaceae bacterium]